MKKITLWVGAGILVVSGAFFIPGYSGDIWSAVISGGIAAILYLIIFAAVWIKKINSPAKRKGIVGVIAVLILGCSFFAFISYKDSVRQQQFLSDIRSTIEEGITYNYVHEPLLETFRMYHTSAGEANMGELFKASFDSLITEDSLYQYMDSREEDSPQIHVVEVTEDRVVLIGESKYVDGKDPDFKNYSGISGKFQTKGILTSKGVHYEREN